MILAKNTKKHVCKLFADCQRGCPPPLTCILYYTINCLFFHAPYMHSEANIPLENLKNLLRRVCTFSLF